MSSRRWGKFWWQDWQRDPALRMCSLAARGLWIDMLCVMNDSDPQGHFLVNGKRPNDRQMAVIFSSSVDEISSLLSELEDAGVFSKTEDGTIFSRRMVRDVEVSEKAKEWGKTGGNPRLNPKSKTKVKAKKSVGVKGGDNPTLGKGVNLHADNSEAEAEAEADIPLTTFEDAAPPSSHDQAQTEIALMDAPASKVPSARDQLWVNGLAVVRHSTGLPDKRARSLMGRWLKDCRDSADTLNAILSDAADTRPIEFEAWVTQAVKARCNPHAIQQQRARAWSSGVMVEGR